MGWHVPNYGSYGRTQLSDRVHLHVGVEVAHLRLLTTTDFNVAGVAVGCDLHTSQRFRYHWTHPAGLRVAATFVMVDEDALGCLIELERPLGDAAARSVAEATAPLVARLWLALELAHNPATSRLWEHGIYAVPPGAA
jgi:hypothetical protein